LYQPKKRHEELIKQAYKNILIAGKGVKTEYYNIVQGKCIGENDTFSVQVCIEHIFQNIQATMIYDGEMENNDNQGITLLLRSEITW